MSQEGAWINEHEHYPDMTTREYLLERGMHWDQATQRFKKPGKAGVGVVSLVIGVTLSGQFVPRSETLESSQNHSKKQYLLTWMGPSFPDAITAYVAAETCQWGRA